MNTHLSRISLYLYLSCQCEHTTSHQHKNEFTCASVTNTCPTLLLLIRPGRLAQGLERDIKDLQAFSEHTTNSVAQLWEHLAMISHSSQRNSSSLGEELAFAAGSIRTQDAVLKTMEVNVETLQERLKEVGWTVQILNHSLSGDVSLHQVKICELQEKIGNVSHDATSMRITQMHLEEQIRNEIEILNVITADLRLKEWEHSMALKNLTVLQGR